MTNYEKLNELFANKAFIEQIKNLDNMRMIHEAVAAEIPGITLEEVEKYLKAVAEAMHTGEISEEEMENVSGGLGWAALLGGIKVAGAVVALIGGCYKVGESVGKFIGNLRS